jgi:hypothetical protein
MSSRAEKSRAKKKGLILEDDTPPPVTRAAVSEREEFRTGRFLGGGQKMHIDPRVGPPSTLSYANANPLT